MATEIRHLYRKPTTIRIGRGAATERLYTLEEATHKAIEKAARELGKVLGHPEDKFWPMTMPHALLDLLHGYSGRASIPAAVAFLEHEGFEVCYPKRGETVMYDEE